MTALWQSPESQRLGWTLLHSIWQGALLFALAAVLLRAMRHRAPQARYLVACCALGVMPVFAVVTYMCLDGTQITKAPQILASAANAWHVAVVRWLPVGWMAGTMLFSMRLLGGWYRLIFAIKVKAAPASSEWQWRLDALSRRLGLAHRARLLISPIISSPLAVGWIKPVVLIPVSAMLHLTPAGLEAILIHELAHIRRHDYFVNFVQSIVEAVFFYHPAAWWLSGQIRVLREHCCDDAAVKHCGDPAPYADALARLESLRTAGVAPKLAQAARGASLKERIRRVLGVSIPVGPSLRTGLLAVAILSMIGTGSLWGFSEDRHLNSAAFILNLESPYIAPDSGAFYDAGLNNWGEQQEGIIASGQANVKASQKRMQEAAASEPMPAEAPAKPLENTLDTVLDTVFDTAFDAVFNTAFDNIVDIITDRENALAEAAAEKNQARAEANEARAEQNRVRPEATPPSPQTPANAAGSQARAKAPQKAPAAKPAPKKAPAARKVPAPKPKTSAEMAQEALVRASQKRLEDARAREQAFVEAVQKRKEIEAQHRENLEKALARESEKDLARELVFVEAEK